MQEQVNSRVIPKWLVITAISVITLVVLVAGGLFAYNQLTIANSKNVAVTEPSPQGGNETVEDSTADDTGAVDALGFALGSLFKYVETYSAESCSELSYVASQLAMSTPLDSYRGTYEKIITNLGAITSVCPYEPANSDSIYLAGETRKNVAKILNDRKWLGMNNWDKQPPVPGKQAQG